MSNALSEEKKQQVIALGKLGWSLRKIERETGVRRETAGAYLRAAGIAVRIPRAWGRRAPAKPANEVTPDSSKPTNEVTPDFVDHLSQKPSPPRAGSVPAALPGPHRGATEPWTECQGHLAGSRYGPRLSRRLPNGKAFRTQAGWWPAAPGSGDHPDRARGRSPGRLRQRSLGPRPANGQVPQDQAVRVDPRI